MINLTRALISFFNLTGINIAPKYARKYVNGH